MADCHMGLGDPRLRFAVGEYLTGRRRAAVVFLAPIAHRSNDRPEFAPFRRQDVLRPRRVLLVESPLNDPV